MARALADNDTNPADEILRPNSEAFLYKLDVMELTVRNATKALLQDNEKYILCLETPETSLMSALLAKTLKNLKKEGFSNQHQDQIFTDFQNVIKINKQQYENWTNFPDLLVCIVGIDDEQQLENYFELLMSWAKLVKNKSKKIIFIMNNSKFLEKSMMKTRMVYVLKVKFTELWKEYDGKSYCHDNKVGHNDSDIFDNAVSKTVNEAMKNIKAKEEISVTSALPTEEEIVKLTSILKLQGVDSMCSVDNQGNTPLHLAAKKGQNKIVKALLVCDAEKESKNKWGFTPLHLAAKEGHHEVISILLENTANVNAINSLGQTPFHMLGYSNSVRSIELLLKFGANIEAKDKNDYTPLHSAIEQGHHEVVIILLEKNANVNAINRDGQTPLHIACCTNNIRSIELLLKLGANIEAKDKNDHTPLHSAIKKNHYEVIIILFENNANVNAFNSVGQTALHMACSTNPNFRSVELLLKLGANIETKDKNGHTPLHLASCSLGGNAVIIKLLAHGSNINAQDNDGQTPLHRAILGNNQQGIKILLENGADRNLKNNSNQNAIDYVRSKWNAYFLIPLFEKHAASAN
ncbi:unnamed protein product [Ceutorhynchus assimilis]|uniref:Uncharacterized protein n=1 Tax=Ceutorhynchus assimilis TaxID=467358 RepID=A0A9N9QEG2_9CUCU|nr:unnamed protein product [Ceutorhynchus assimilis]